MTDIPPEPLTPPDCDLRGMEWMPLYGDRLFASETWLMAGPEGRCAALALWWAAWKQCPAGSLADQDRVLAQLAGYGMGIKAWQAIREEAMRGWVRCSDGRLYHPVVCELALEAWDRRRRERARKDAWRKKGDKDAPGTGTTPDGDGDNGGGERGQPPNETGTRPGQDADGDGDGTRQGRAGNGVVPGDRTGQDRTGKVESKNPPTPQPKPPPDAGAGDVRQAFDAWNAIAAECGLGAARKLDPDRARKIGARLRENGGMPAWTEALAAIRRSPYLRGENDKDWSATLDFVCQPSSFRKLIEGFYSTGKPTPAFGAKPRGTASNPARDRLLAAYPALADEAGCNGAQGPPGWFGIVDWIATLPDIEPGTVPTDPNLGLSNQGATMPSINGYLLPRAAVSVCEAAGLPESARPRLDPIADWCRAGLDFDLPPALEAVRRQANRMRDQGDQIQSLAVFDRTVRAAMSHGVHA